MDDGTVPHPECWTRSIHLEVQMLLHSKRTIATLTAVAALTVGATAPVAFARHGADDPVGHNAGDDHGKKGRGADDKAGDDRGGLKVRAARHGADDPAGDDRGG